MNSRSLLAGFFSRLSIAYAVLIGAILSREALTKRNVTDKFLRGLRGSSLLLGILVGALVLGRLADIYGRRSVLFRSSAIRGLGMLLNPYVSPYRLALTIRFIAGFGIGGAMAATTSYVLERSSKEVRGRNVVLMESMRARGSTIAAIAAIIAAKSGISRQVAFASSALFALITMFLIYVSPETYVRRAKLGDENARRIAEEMGFVIGEKRSVRELLTVFLKYTLLLRTARAIVGFAYYYRAFTIRDVLAKLGSSALGAYEKIAISLAAQLIGYTYAYLLIDRIGRRPLLISSYILGALALPLYFVSPTLAGAAFVAFNVGVRGTIYTYTPELYPTDFRATALGSAVAMARVGAILGPIVGAYAISIGLGMRVAILAIVHASGAIFVFPLPETKGKTLE